MLPGINYKTLIRATGCVAFLLLLSSCSWPLLRALPIIGESYESPVWKGAKSPKTREFRATLEAVLGAPFTANNRISTFINGDQIFPAIFEELRAAKESIFLESYILWDGKIADKIIHILTEKAKSGVRVSVIFDWHGSEGTGGLVKDLENAGAEIEFYHPLTWYNPQGWKDLGNLDNRTHRRLLIIDGRVAFTGGAAFGDEWMGDARNENEWRDTHYKIEGPAVQYLAGIFSENWWSSDRAFNFLTNEEPFSKGDTSVQVVKSSPSVAIPTGVITFSAAIESAEESILIGTPYFVPEDTLLEKLESAAKRGVKVELIVPGESSDKAVVRTASRGLWGNLLKLGSKIYEYQPSLYHCKLLIADGVFVSIGTSNWDSRSLRLNDEVIVNVLDHKFAAEQRSAFEKDKLKSKLITYEEWSNRPFWERFFDSLARRTRNEL